MKYCRRGSLEGGVNKTVQPSGASIPIQPGKNPMSYQKTYRKQSANQILKDATISVMNAGNVEITHPEWQGCIFVRDQDGDLVITDQIGGMVRLICSVRAAEKLQDLDDAREAKQIEVLRAEDEKNGTTYAQYL